MWKGLDVLPAGDNIKICWPRTKGAFDAENRPCFERFFEILSPSYGFFFPATIAFHNLDHN